VSAPPVPTVSAAATSPDGSGEASGSFFGPVEGRGGELERDAASGGELERGARKGGRRGDGRFLG
jgi:hypothetical protein